MLRNRLLASVPLAALACAGWSANYSIRPNLQNQTAEVRISIGDRTSRAFHMPGWAAGDYWMFNYGEQVRAIAFLNDGRPVQSTKSGVNSWRTEQPFDEVRYSVGESRGHFAVNLRVAADHMMVSPGGVLGWIEGASAEEQVLTIELPMSTWQAMCALPTRVSTHTSAIYVAEDMHELLDSPFVAGNLQVERFDLFGKPHYIVGYGALRPPEDLRELASIASHAVQQGHAQFDGLPYERFIFFCDFGQGGGGLEHRASTTLGVGRTPADRLGGLIFHEYMHTWNVKRIRPVTYVKRDYLRPAASSTLWWLEGVTDYYADVWMYRSGQMTRDELLSSLGGELARLRRNRAVGNVSAAEASNRVWESKGSNGYGGLSYYQKGKLIGFILDASIRANSHGRESLDTVIERLWEESKAGTVGYRDERIRELVAEAGGQETAALYDVAVFQAQTMPFETVLPKIGLRLVGGEIQHDPSARDDVRAMGLTWPWPVGD